MNSFNGRVNNGMCNFIRMHIRRVTIAKNAIVLAI